MAESAQELASLVEYVVTPLVDDPDEVDISLTEEDGRVLIEIHVNESDAGKVIGRQGRVIKSIRTLVRAPASRKGAHVEVELID